MKKLNIFDRQGDVGLQYVKLTNKEIEAMIDLPPDPNTKYVTLAYGETSGHAHCLLEKEVEFKKDPATGKRYLLNRTEKSIFLQHGTPSGLQLPPKFSASVSDHTPIEIPANTGIEVVDQNEYAPGAIKRVGD